MDDKYFSDQLERLSKEAGKSGNPKLQALLLVLSGTLDGGDVDFYYDNTKHVHKLLLDRVKGRIIDRDSKLN